MVSFSMICVDPSSKVYTFFSMVVFFPFFMEIFFVIFVETAFFGRSGSSSAVFFFSWGLFFSFSGLLPPYFSVVVVFEVIVSDLYEEESS